MKSRSIWTLHLSLATLILVTSTAGAAVVGHWELDETTNPSGGTTAVDNGPNGLNGTYQPVGGPGPVVGLGGATLATGSSANFNGTNDEIYLGNPAALGALSNNFTITAWINPDDTAGVQRVFSRYGAGGQGFGFGLNNDGLRFTTYGILDYNTSAGLVDANKWQHVAVVFDANNDASFYVNGTFVQTINGAAPANPGGNNFFIGRTGVSEAYDGLIDDVQIHSGSLTAAQIATLAGMRGGQLAHYEFSETGSPSTGVMAMDSSGRGNNGTYASPVLGQPGPGGTFGTAAQFNGTTDAVNLGSVADFKMKNDFTIAAWVNPDDLSGVQRVFSQGGSYGFGLNGDELRFTTYGVLDYNTNGADLVAGEWAHIAVVFDENNDANFYVNGQFLQTVAGVNPANLNANGDFFIGTQQGATEFFGGLIDELYVFQGALTPDQIAELATISAVPEPMSLGLWGLVAAVGFAYRWRKRRGGNTV